MTDDLTTLGGLIESIFWLLIGAVVTAMIVNVSVAIVRQAYATVDIAKEMSEQTTRIEEVINYD